ncbi:unnamed protein product [Caretta caretta]
MNPVRNKRDPFSREVCKATEKQDPSEQCAESFAPKNSIMDCEGTLYVHVSR